MTTKTDYIFTLKMKVRDYELDSQGIVNNANYLHYMENTRHEFIHWAGISFAEMHQMGIDPVVHQLQIRYIHPLVSGDEFTSCINLHRRGPLFIFQQDIYCGDKPITKGQVEIACIVNGKLTRGDELYPYFKKYLEPSSEPQEEK